MTLAALLAVALVVRLGGGHLVVDTDQITPELLLATNLGLALCIPLAGVPVVEHLRAQAALARLRGTRPALAVAGDLCRRSPARSGECCSCCAMLAVSRLRRRAASTARSSAYIVVALLTTPLQAAGEEYLFRGFLLQSLGATRLAAPVCWVVSGAIFATAHGQFAPPLFADRWLIGIVFAWLATTTGGLEASIALHAVKNITVLIPAAILGELSGAIDPTGVTWLPFALDAVMLGHRRLVDPVAVPAPDAASAAAGDLASRVTSRIRSAAAGNTSPSVASQRRTSSEQESCDCRVRKGSI